MYKLILLCALALCACGAVAPFVGSLTETRDGGPSLDAAVAVPSDAGVEVQDAGMVDPGPYFQHVIVVLLENQNDSDVYNSSNAPYLNSLMKQYAWASQFADVLPQLPSEPHYIWLEAGTNAFSDITFTNDDDASAKNSTSSTKHLSTLLDAKGVSWIAYQEGMSNKPGACPIASDSSTAYGAKHNPFVFFRDVSGAPPSKDNMRCASHMKPIDALSTDMASNKVPAYALVTPDQCHDMHGAVTCPGQLLSEASRVKAGDDWLKGFLPPVITWARANRGLVLVTWDEPQGKTGFQPFIVVGEGLKTAGYESKVRIDLSSVLKSLQRILQVSPKENVPYLGHAADAATRDLSDFFKPGYFP